LYTTLQRPIVVAVYPASSDPIPDYILKFEAIVPTQLYPDSPGIFFEDAGNAVVMDAAYICLDQQSKGP